MIEIEWCKQHNAYFKGCVYCEYDKVTESFSKALSSNIQTNMNLTHANEEISKLKAVLATVQAMAVDAVELNTSNYNHDDVCQLNDEMCAIYLYLLEALQGQENG
jgi:hypothetical protein